MDPSLRRGGCGEGGGNGGGGVGIGDGGGVGGVSGELAAAVGARTSHASPDAPSKHMHSPMSARQVPRPEQSPGQLKRPPVGSAPRVKST